MSQTTLRIGYVPEHFSSPLLQLAALDPSVTLVSCPSGTGQLIAALKADEIDISIALTEALITGIAKRTAEYKLVGTYVTSSLNWAVIAGKETKYQKIEDLRGEVIGISRIGSGSQVMASYMALKQGWTAADGTVEPIKFEILDNFKNLRDGVNDGRAAAFMWEHSTSKPFLNETRFIGHVPTPWSSWLLAASTSATANPLLKPFLENLSKSIQAFDAPAARAGSSKEFIIKQFGYEPEDVQSWLDAVTYPKAGVQNIEKSTIMDTLSTLVAAGVLTTPEAGWNVEDFVDTSIATLV